MKDTYFIFIIFTTIIGLSLLSCNNEDITVVTAIELTHTQPTTIVGGGTFDFQVNANNSTDVTPLATIKVDGEALDAHSFTTGIIAKTYEVQAFYQGVESPKVFVNTTTPSDDVIFTKNALIEDYTGTWCGWCPRVAYAIQQAKEQSDQVVAVAIHSNSSTVDPFSFEDSELLKTEFGVEGLPEGRINRIHTWTSPEPENIDEVINHTGMSSIGIAINSTLESGTINATVNVKFSASITTDLKLVVYLLESGMHYDQTNYTADYFSDGYQNPLPDFEHEDVLRAVYTNHFGEVIPSSETTAWNTYTLDLSKSLPSTIENTEHLTLVAFVVHADTNEVINVRENTVGEDQAFQEN